MIRGPVLAGRQGPRLEEFITLLQRDLRTLDRQESKQVPKFWISAARWACVVISFEQTPRFAIKASSRQRSSEPGKVFLAKSLGVLEFAVGCDPIARLLFVESPLDELRLVFGVFCRISSRMREESQRLAVDLGRPVGSKCTRECESIALCLLVEDRGNDRMRGELNRCAAFFLRKVSAIRVRAADALAESPRS